MTPEYTRCPACSQRVRVNADGALRVHLSHRKDHLGVRIVCVGSSMTVMD